MLHLHPAITKLLASEQNPQVLQVGSADRALLEQMKHILSVFVCATTLLSGRKQPTLQIPLCYYTVSIKRLAAIHDIKVLAIDCPSIATTCFPSWIILHNYWTNTGAFTSQTIAMILYPRYKIKRFNQTQLEPQSITTAKSQFGALFKAQYAISIDPTLENTATNSLALHRPPVTFDEDDDFAFTSGVPVAKVAEIVTETKLSLCEATTVGKGSNPLVWFRVRVGTGTKPLQRFLPQENPDRCNWASFTTKNPAFQPHNFVSN